MTATPSIQPCWRLVADFAADLDIAAKGQIVDLLADAALGADPAADVYAGRPSPWPATDPCRQASLHPATAGEARKRVEDAKRTLYARIIASAHLLDQPFTNAPKQSPWTRLKQSMDALTAALAKLDAAPATYMLPAEPPPEVDKLWDRVGLRWDRDGTDARDGYRFWRSERGWVFHYPELLMRQGPLSTCPPTDTEEATDA